MTYTIDRDGETLTVLVRGRLDINTTPELEKGLDGHLDDITSLTIDLAGVDYVSSMGLRLLLALQKRMFKQGEMQVINVTSDVMLLFEDTGFSDILTIR